MAKSKDAKVIKEQYDMLDDVTKAYAVSVLQAMTSALQAIYYINAMSKKGREENVTKA